MMQDWATAPLPITTYVALRKPNVHGLVPTPFGLVELPADNDGLTARTC